MTDGMGPELERRRQLGRGPHDNLMCFLVQTAISSASALAEIKVRLAVLESRLNPARLLIAVRDIAKILAPWTGVILAVIMWVFGKGSLIDVQTAISNSGGIGTGH